MSSAIRPSYEETQDGLHFISFPFGLTWYSFASGSYWTVRIPCMLIGSRWVVLSRSELLLSGGVIVERKRYTYTCPKEWVYKLSLLKDFASRSVSAMLYYRHQHFLLQNAGFVYAIGGDTDKCEKYDLTADVWTEIESLPYALCDCVGTLSLLTSSVYVIGEAKNFRGQFKLVEYSFHSADWRELACDTRFLSNPLKSVSQQNPSVSDQLCFIAENALIRFDGTNLSFSVLYVDPNLSDSYATSFYRWELYCADIKGRVKTYGIPSTSNP